MNYKDLLDLAVGLGCALLLWLAADWMDGDLDSSKVLVAIAHILGAVFVVIGAGFGNFVVLRFLEGRDAKKTLAKVAIETGIPINELDDPKRAPALIKHLSQRFSSDLFVNRISDLCGVMRTAWLSLGSLLNVCVFAAVVYSTFSESLDEAAYAWLMVAIALFFWLVSVLFSFACFVLFGRFPGQAREARKMLVELVT